MVVTDTEKPNVLNQRKADIPIFKKGLHSNIRPFGTIAAHRYSCHVRWSKLGAQSIAGIQGGPCYGTQSLPTGPCHSPTLPPLSLTAGYDLGTARKGNVTWLLRAC
ncbi:hypothetical protein XELAEV_18022416mg [Xenopus laevis]|uniref:Uncharacterized protein n=1 Tax=Xenopus laevis TaxID=8355 RepID=A0A974D281_XENLA|nr:hypothetical protein XELAEV_18022416mg [Xenopus laevis]